MLPNQRRLEVRRRRLLSSRPWARREAYYQRQLYAETRDPRYLALTGRVESSFTESTAAKEDTASGDRTSTTMATSAAELEREERRRERQKSSRSGLTHFSFTSGSWCYDTPGTVSDEQATSKQRSDNS